MRYRSSGDDKKMKLSQIENVFEKNVRRKSWAKNNYIYFYDDTYGWASGKDAKLYGVDNYVNQVVATQFMCDDWEEYHVAPFPCSPDGMSRG